MLTLKILFWSLIHGCSGLRGAGESSADPLLLPIQWAQILQMWCSQKMQEKTTPSGHSHSAGETNEGKREQELSHGPVPGLRHLPDWGFSSRVKTRSSANNPSSSSHPVTSSLHIPWRASCLLPFPQDKLTSSACPAFNFLSPLTQQG